MAATALDPRRRRLAVSRPAFGSDDDGLVRRVRDGDDSAFEAIYDRYAPGLLAFCHHLLANRADAEDALQHSLSAAYRMLRAGDGDVELRPWLYTVARNRCLSVLRARRTDISLDAAPEPGGIADEIVDQVQRRSDLRDLVQDLRLLPEDQRSAIVLFELGGLPHDEIATVLEVRREKVKALVFQAREGLMRARRARDMPCTEMRRQLATLTGGISSRSMLRRHVDRCPSCALFEAEVGRQRAGLALILPVLPTVGLKASVLGSTVGRLTAVAGGGASAGGGAAVLGSAAGGGGAVCAGAGGGVTGLAGAGAGAAGSGSVLAGAAGGGVGGALATAGGAGTMAAAIGAKSATVVVAKLLTAVAVAVGGGAAATGEIGQPLPHAGSVPAVQRPFFSATAPSLAGAAEPIAPAAPVPAGPTAAAGAPAHDPLAATAPGQPVKATAVSQPVPIPAAGTPAALDVGLPFNTGTDPGATPAPVPGPAGNGLAVTTPPKPADATPATTTTSPTTVGATTTVSTPVAEAPAAGTTTAEAPPAAPAAGSAAPATADSATPAAGTPTTGATGAPGNSGSAPAGATPQAADPAPAESTAPAALATP